MPYTSTTTNSEQCLSKLTGLTLDASGLILSALEDAAQLTPIPYLQDAAGLALGIINIIQGVKENQEAFQRLANDACGLVYAILCSSNSTSTAVLSPILLNNLRELLATLASIEKFAKKQVKRTKLIRTITSKSDLGTVQEYRGMLKQSLDLFGLKSNISIQENIAQIAARQEELIMELREQEARREATMREKEAREQELKERERVERRAVERKREEAEREREGERLKRETVYQKREDERREREKLQQESLQRQKAQQDRLGRERLEQQRVERERLESPHAAQYAYAPATPAGTPPIALSNPFRTSPNMFFPHLYSANGKFKMTSIGGDYNVSSGNVSNVNSGNTANSTVTNSHNDSSVRTYKARCR